MGQSPPIQQHDNESGHASLLYSLKHVVLLLLCRLAMVLDNVGAPGTPQAPSSPQVLLVINLLEARGIPRALKKGIHGRPWDPTGARGIPQALNKGTQSRPLARYTTG